MRIYLEPHMKYDVPGSVFASSKFRFDPSPFNVGARKVEPEDSNTCLSQYLSTLPKNGVYMVCGKFDTKRARYFAAFLAQVYKNRYPSSSIEWVTTYPPSYYELEFDFASAPKLKYDPDFLVIEGLTKDGHRLQIEKVRDTLETWCVPSVVIASGMTPGELATLIAKPLNFFAYFGEQVIESL